MDMIKKKKNKIRPSQCTGQKSEFPSFWNFLFIIPCPQGNPQQHRDRKLSFKSILQEINGKFGLSLYMTAGMKMVPTKAVTSAIKWHLLRVTLKSDVTFISQEGAVIMIYN